MSAAENKQLMQEIFARVAVGDGSLFVGHLADDVVIHVSGQYEEDDSAALHREMTEYQDSTLCERVLGLYALPGQ